jgi:hypothetical protein
LPDVTLLERFFTDMLNCAQSAECKLHQPVDGLTHGSPVGAVSGKQFHHAIA